MSTENLGPGSIGAYCVGSGEKATFTGFPRVGVTASYGARYDRS